MSALAWALAGAIGQALWAGLAALCFAVLFNVPRRTLAGCAVAGATGYALRALAMQLGWGIEASTLLGAAAIGLLGKLFARRWQAPAMIFTVAGAIPLAPGAFAFRTMIGILQVASAGPEATAPMLVAASVSAIKTGLILGAIAAGIAAPSLLFGRRQPVV